MTTHQDLIDNLMCKFNGVQIGKATLFNCDCNDLMACLPDKAFELSCVDPPYGIKEDGHRENNRSKKAISKNYHKALWDQPRPCRDYFLELERISVNQVIWGGNHLADLICRYSPCWIVWDKDNSGYFADCELAYTSFKTAARKFKYRWNGMLQEDMANKETRIHPTQKPVKLYEWLLANYAKPGQRILDTHLGSMSSVIACLNMGFEIVGCELDADYFKAGVDRVRDSQKQQRLFEPMMMQGAA